MSMPTKDGIFVTWRKGDVENPYISISETVTVVNNLAILKEIPDEFTKVTIAGYFETRGPIDSENKFKCDYQRGILTFHPSKSGSLIDVSYKGRGLIEIPASRVLSQNPNTDVYENLQEIIDNGFEAITKLGEVEGVITEAEAATAHANSFDWKGLWNSNTAYTVNSMVSYQGSSYICKQEHTNKIPAIGGTAYWDILSEKSNVSNALIDDSLTIKDSLDATKNIKIQRGTSGGIEFVVN